MRPLNSGHAYCWPLPAAANRQLLAAFESCKLSMHLRRGGSYFKHRRRPALRDGFRHHPVDAASPPRGGEGPLSMCGGR
jgi:hypothetical protein